MKKAILLIGLLVLIVALSGCTQSTGQASLSSTNKTDCPYECCKDTSQYFGKVCALDAECVDNECVNVEESGVQEQSEESTEGGQEHVAAIVESDTSQPAQQQEQLACPSSCNDGNPCTTDSCSKDTNYECKHDAITPCCGNNSCESNENYFSCSQDCRKTCPPSCDDSNPCTNDYCSVETNYNCNHLNLDGSQGGCSGNASVCKENLCNSGICTTRTTNNCCGNSTCETGENYNTCASDCERPNPTCPANCDDGNPCTDDYCNESTNYLCSNNILNGEAVDCSGSAGTCKINSCVNGACQQQTQTNCCGNSQCEILESHLSCPVDCECTPNWQCTSWSTCNGGVKTRTCYDYSYCETTQDKPAESQSCTMSITEKIRECARKCSGADADIPAVYYEFYEVCYELYYYVGMGEMENFMKDC